MSSATKKILLFFLSFFWVVGALGSFLSLISRGGVCYCHWLGGSDIFFRSENQGVGKIHYR